MDKIFYLKTCDTCSAILKSINTEGFELREIKSNPITEQELEELRKRVSSYAELLNKRARLYRERGLKDEVLTEEKIKALILEEYTFLKRPAVIAGSKAYIGSGKKTKEALQRALG